MGDVRGGPRSASFRAVTDPKAFLSRSILRAVAPGLFALAGCGPEAVELPPTGIYHFEVVTLENACDPHLDMEWGTEEIVEVAADAIEIPASVQIGIPPGDCEVCVAAAVWDTFTAVPEGERYVARSEATDERCRHDQLVEVEVLDGERLRTRVTSEWREVNGCPWVGATAAGCTVVHEYTWTLQEPCECSFPLAQWEG